jgi:integrase
MPRVGRKLSAVKLWKLPPGIHGDGLNLYLQVTPSGNRSWLFRYMLNGRSRGMGLGPLHTIGLADARERALAARRLVLDGADPIEQRRDGWRAAALDAARSATIGDCAERYIASHEASWRNSKHRDQWRTTLRTYTYPLLGELAVAAVDTGLVLRVLEPIWHAKSETASRVRGRLETVLDWATARGYRHGENPARWRGHLDKLLPKRSRIAPVRHHPAMPYRDVPAYMAALAGSGGLSALALRFTILTAARTAEAIYARWPEIDRGAAIWSIPAGRMKAQRAHRAPLSAPALAVLAAVPHFGGGDFVFPSALRGRPLSSGAMHHLLKGTHPHLTVHGFRSAFRDWAFECTDHARDIVEAALTHVSGDKVELAYRRGDALERRRVLMADWAAFCGGPQ